MKHALEACDLVYTYQDGARALDGASFAADKGEITALLGANGAGKSTLFLNMNGIYRPDSGTVYLEGQPVSYSKKGLLDIRKRVGIVFQDPDDQLFSADVYRDISFGGVNLGLSQEEVRRRVEAAMESTGVSHLKNKPTHALSHGQKKRVAIAGVLVMELDVMIFDEPTAGLDPAGVSEIMRLLVRLKEELGIAIIISTHDLDLVPLYCDKTVLMADGRTVFSGKPEELFSRPDILRGNHLRLPRISHLMEILRDEDGLDVNIRASTISAARIEILRQIRGENP